MSTLIDALKNIRGIPATDHNAFRKVQEIACEALNRPAPEAAPVDDGSWVQVPRAPTYQMAEAMGVKWESGEGFPRRFAAMIAAAPTREAAPEAWKLPMTLAECMEAEQPPNAQGEQEDVMDLLAVAYDNLSDMPICEEWAQSWCARVLPLFTRQQPAAAPPAEPVDLSELLAAVDEVVRITDRKHNAWDRLKAALTAAKAAQPCTDERACVNCYSGQGPCLIDGHMQPPEQAAAIAVYQDMLARGYSDYEARDTAWPPRPAESAAPGAVDSILHIFNSWISGSGHIGTLREDITAALAQPKPDAGGERT
jgi:hypothetical protein